QQGSDARERAAVSAGATPTPNRERKFALSPPDFRPRNVAIRWLAAARLAAIRWLAAARLAAIRPRRAPSGGRVPPSRTSTRGFSGRGKAARDPRLPPGQYDTGRSWPVLTAEPTPNLDTSTWTFRVEGEVAKPVEWTWQQMHELPRSTYEGDIHCVTTWSRL